jgi:hypothetical protein
MNYAEMRGVKLVLADLTKRLDNVADLGKHLNRLSERQDNQENFLKVKIYSIYHSILSIRLNLIA